MKKVAMLAAAVLGFALVYGVYQFQTSRMTPLTLEQIRKAKEQMNVAEAAEKQATPASTASSAGGTTSKEEKPMATTADTAQGETDGKTPDVFKVQFETSKGNVVVECQRAWAPHGVDRFYELLTKGFYDDNRFFRVVKKPRPFVVQFGINGDPRVMDHWRDESFPDDPVTESNKRGTLTFAAGNMPNSRTTQLFINLSDNTPLDGMRFAVIGKVISGMEAVDAITDEYGEQPSQDQIQRRGNEYLNQAFPNMDYIKKATIIK